MINNKEQSTVLLGLSLAENELDLIRFASKFCQSTGSKLVLGHVIKPFQYYAFAGEAPVFPLDTYGPVMDEMDENNALKRLEALQTTEVKIPCEIKIKRDSPSEGLEEIAEEIDADLIIVATDFDSSLWQGLSTSISLLKFSQRPVMVIPSKISFDWEQPTTVYCGDDLSPECSDTLKMAVAMARGIEAKAIVPYHMRDMSQQDIDRMIEHVKTAAVLGKIPEEEITRAETYKERVIEETKQQLHLRIKDLFRPDELQARSEVLFGKASQELPKLLAKDKGNKLMVFGKHHIFHPRSFSLGRVPYPTMLEQGAAVLVVP